MRDRVTWPDLEAALQARDGWRRVGKEWRGPCPVTGAGTRGAWFQPGGTVEIVGGCHKCGRLDADSFKAHLAALAGETARPVAAHGPTAGRRIVPPSDLPARIWLASEAPDGTPGARYLVERRKAWPAGARLPAAVRWLPVDAARGVGVTPRLPRGAAGCVVYLFAAPGEPGAHACQLEAVTAAGDQRRFYPWLPKKKRPKRVGVHGADFNGGRRVFHAGGDPDRAIHVCEGPINALSLVHLERLGAVALAGGAVHGTNGAALFRPAACPGRVPVTIWPDNDPHEQGQVEAAKLFGALGLAGRRVTIRRVPSWYGDVNDWVRAILENRAEREAIQHES